MILCVFSSYKAIVKLVTLFTVILTLRSFDCYSQSDNYKFTRIDISKGLSHNQVNCILKDKRGFVWFGTLSGLSRYDGYNFKIFRHDSKDNTSINDNYINRIFEDNEGKLWVGTREGFVIYNPEKEIFDRNIAGYLGKLGIDAESPIEIVNLDKNRLCIVTSDYKLYEYSYKTKQAKYINNLNDTLKGIQPQLYSVIPDHDGNIWLISTTGILELVSADNYEVLYRDYTIYRNFPKEYMDFRMFVDADNDLWVYAANSSQGLYFFNNRTRSFRHFNTISTVGKLSSNIIRGLEQDDKGLIWVGTDHGGINLINKNGFTTSYLLSNPYDDRSLSQNTITTLYKDNVGIIWAGTFKKGVSYYHEDVIKFRLIKHQTSDPQNITYDDVNCFSEDRDGNLWIGTNGGGLVFYDRKENRFRHYKHNPDEKNSLSNDVIVCMYMDKQEKLWIGTYFGGLNCFDGIRFIHYRHNPDNTNSLADDRVWDIYEDSENNLWIGTLGGGLDLFNPVTEEFKHFRYAVDSLLTSDFISSITEDSKNNIWIGTAVGINVYNKRSGLFTYYAASAGDAASLINDNINCIKIDSRNNIWIGTREGLSMFSPLTETFRNFTKNDGLPDNSVFSIAEDHNGNLWLGTTNGLSNLIVESSKYGDTLDFTFKNFDESDGLQGKEFNKSAAFKTSTGELLFGGTNGFNLFYPENIRTNKRIPDIVFTNLQIFNNEIKVDEKINGRVILDRSITETDRIVLKYHENVISIEFSALDYFQPEKNQYEYMLEGFNNTWMKADAGIRKATYTNLNQGDYIFRVRASNNDGVWNKEGVSLIITILPPFWKTKTALVIYFFIVIGLLLLLRYLILERERMHHRAQQERLDAHRRHEIDMLKIKFITNISHEFKTPLSLIISPLENLIKNSGSTEQSKYLTLIYRNARRLLNLVNQLLDFRRIEFQEVKLILKEGDIISYTGDIADSFSDLAEKKEIEYSFRSPLKELKSFFDHDKIEKITFNLLSNAFKFTPEKGKIEVTVELVTAETAGFKMSDQDAESYICIRVKDTGIGIPPEKQKKIFERFFSENNSRVLINQGSGIGLSLVNEFVKSHKGRIKLESEQGKGSSFEVYLPLILQLPPEDKKTIPGKDYPDEYISAETVELHESMEKTGTRKPVILLVEDNADFLFYLKDNLKMNYSIIEASNGLEGWHTARHKVPDLIVTDIMMPEMDGIELCKMIKSDKNTSHIPVILLTGRTANKKRVEGFELGADDYITKPFSFEILESRIKNLILQRELIRKSFQKRFELTPSEIQITSLDDKLIKKALTIVETNISDADFSVDKLSREIGMSRVHLYKKLTSLTGKTPIEFIRIIRLRRAAQLLEKSQLSVSEIAYQVGFNNPKYFTKYFKSEYKFLPSEYASMKQTKSSGPKSF